MCFNIKLNTLSKQEIIPTLYVLYIEVRGLFYLHSVVFKIVYKLIKNLKLEENINLRILSTDIIPGGGNSIFWLNTGSPMHYG